VENDGEHIYNKKTGVITNIIYKNYEQISQYEYDLVKEFIEKMEFIEFDSKDNYESESFEEFDKEAFETNYTKL
jgi:hypothetical protein